MKTSRDVLGVGILLGVLTTPAWAMQFLETTGYISAVDAERNPEQETITLVADASHAPPLHLFVTNDTKIINHGVHLLPADLQPSSTPVKVRSTIQDGKAVARSLVVTTPRGLHQTSGILQAIDPLQREVIITRGGGLRHDRQFHVKLTEATGLSFQGERRYITDLNPGDRLMVEYTSKDGINEAQWISVVSP